MHEDELAFLAAIKAAPEDLAPHLVFADWLDEQGRHEDAAYQRGWTPRIGKMEQQLRDAARRIDELEAEVEEANCGC